MPAEENKVRFTISEIRNRFSERRARRRLRAFALLLASGLVVTQVFPTLAENNTGGSGSSSETTTATTLPTSETQTVTSTSEPSDSESSNDSQAQDGDESNSEDEPSPTPPPPPPPPYATGSQDILITMPSSLRVDPRASTVFLPQSSFYSTNTLMICISSSILRFDLGQAGAIDDSDSEYLMLSGDLTNSVIIAGNSALVSSYLNSEKGLRLFRAGAGIAGYGAVFRFVDISEPSLDDTLCGDGALANNRYLQVVPLGLNQNITKAKVGLDNGKKRG